MTQKITYIFFLLSVVFTYGQVSLIAAAEEKDYKVNQPFDLTIILEITGNDLVQQSPLQLPDFSKFNFVGSASEQKTLLDDKKNIAINQLVYRAVLTPKFSGRVKVGSVLVTVNDKIYKTEPFDIFVKEADKKLLSENDRNKDFYLNLEVEDKNVYENQPTKAVLRAYGNNFECFRKVNNIVAPKQKNLTIKAIDFDPSDIESSSNKNDLLSQVIAVYMVFPNASGNVEILPIVANYTKSSVKKYKITSNRVVLSVKKLPANAPINFKNAIGNFQISLTKKIIDDDIEVNKPIDMIIKIDGDGNLGNFHIPKLLPSTKYRFFAPKIVRNYNATENGMKGEIIANYVIIPSEAGPMTVSTEDFSFFNPSTKQYVDLGSKSIDFVALTTDQISDTKTTLEKVNEYTANVLQQVHAPEIIIHEEKTAKKSYNWKGIFEGLIILSGIFMIVFIYYKKKKKNNTTKKVTIKHQTTSFAEVEAGLKENMKMDIADYFAFLEKIKNNEDYNQFFIIINELDSEVKTQCLKNYEGDFRNFLEENKGPKIVEEYTVLMQKIEVERYNPLHTEEQLDQLLQEVINLYSKISK